MKRSISAGLCFLSITLFALIASGQTNVPQEIKGGILNGKAVNLPKPEYSAEAKAANLEGTVKINVLIDEQGNVISAEPVVEQASTATATDGTAKTVEADRLARSCSNPRSGPRWLLSFRDSDKRFSRKGTRDNYLQFHGWRPGRGRSRRRAEQQPVRRHPRIRQQQRPCVRMGLSTWR